MGYDGQLPKLDLFMLAEHSLRRVAGFSTALPILQYQREYMLPAFLRQPLSDLTSAVAELLPESWCTQQYGRKLAQLCSFTAQQALGLPQGAHAPCKQYGIDAVTVRTAPGSPQVCDTSCWFFSQHRASPDLTDLTSSICTTLACELRGLLLIVNLAASQTVTAISQSCV